MKRNMLILSLLCALFTVTLILVSCGNPVKNSENSSQQKIKIACVATTEPIANYIKSAIELDGREVDLVMFDGNSLPATALKDGSVDAVFANHLPWIKTFNAENNTDLQMIQPYYYFSPFRIYSTKHERLEDIPDGARVIIPNDPANQDRSIRMLSEIGFIKLNEKKGNFYTIIDIAENTKNLKFTEMEIINTARSIRDVDFIFAMAFIAQSTGNIDSNVYLYEDPLSEDYPMSLIVNKENVNADWAVNAMNTVKNEEYKEKFNEQFKGTFTLID